MTKRFRYILTSSSNITIYKSFQIVYELHMTPCGNTTGNMYFKEFPQGNKNYNFNFKWAKSRKLCS
jgi:hypothetical protein